jgi:small subunit ribosomal protein S3
VIERAAKKIKIGIFAFKPKLIIGDSGATIEKIKLKISEVFAGEVMINVHHVQKPNLESSIVAYNIAKQIENYTPFRLAMKKSIEETMRQNAKGIKVSCSGRLGGAEIARTESYKVGRVPLHTLRADIDYAQYNAKTKYGIIGIKVWIYRESSAHVKKINI